MVLSFANEKMITIKSSFLFIMFDLFCSALMQENLYLIIKKLRTNRELKCCLFYGCYGKLILFLSVKISYRRDLHKIIQKSFKIHKAIISDLNLMTSLIIYFFFFSATLGHL